MYSVAEGHRYFVGDHHIIKGEEIEAVFKKVAAFMKRRKKR